MAHGTRLEHGEMGKSATNEEKDDKRVSYMLSVHRDGPFASSSKVIRSIKCAACVYDTNLGCALCLFRSLPVVVVFVIVGIVV